MEDQVTTQAHLSLIELATEIAKSHGGALLADCILSANVRLLWKCANGHQWTARLANVRRGTWCPECQRTRVTIEDMRALAKERGGACLSDEYRNNQTKLRWRCSEFHEWNARPNNIRRNWCPVCAHSVKLDIGLLRRIARERGGVLLSTQYINSHEPLEWRCAEGHTWRAAASSIKPTGFFGGTWCPHCPTRHKGRPARLTIEEMQEIAHSRQGECLSKIYVNGKEKLEWRCAQGHRWKAQPAVVKRGSWCPECAGKRKLTLEELQEDARARGGKLLSENYRNTDAPLLWECAEGHRWEIRAASIRSGSWCPHCAGVAPLSLEEMQALARSRGGQCLSKTYINVDTPLKWQCAEGHVWVALPEAVKRKGTWCPDCAHAPDYTLEDMRRIAAAKGGECLSTIYVNSKTALKWRCAEGHTWEAQPQCVIPGPNGPRSWCRRCARRRLMMADMQELARASGGECISKIYVDRKTKLRWRCAEGHEWEALPSNVKPHGSPPKGSWCRICARRKA